jgi:hypothetical protein
MPLFHRIVDRKVYETMDLVTEFLDIWIQTRKPKDIDTDELAGVIDVLYDFQPSPGRWVVIEVKPKELAQYINIYINHRGEEKPMMSSRDNKLSAKYVELLKKGYEPTPIMIAGATEKNDDGEYGIVLIDGRHRIYSFIEAEHETCLAYIPYKDVPKMAMAKL